MPSLWSMIPATPTIDISLSLSKADRLHTNESSMTHAMVIFGVHVDLQSGKPLRAKSSAWKVAAGKRATGLLCPELIEVHVYRYAPTQPQLPFVANRLTGHSCAYAHHRWCWSEPVSILSSLRALHYYNYFLFSSARRDKARAQSYSRDSSRWLQDRTHWWNASWTTPANTTHVSRFFIY